MSEILYYNDFMFRMYALASQYFEKYERNTFRDIDFV